MTSNTSIFERYDLKLAFHDRVAGSVPSAPTAVWEMVQRQIMTSQGLTREQIREQEVFERARLFLMDTGKDVADLSLEDLKKMAQEEASGAVNVFRRDGAGLYLAAHQLKAALKEAVNVLYAKERWGKTGKGPIGFVAERVFLTPAHLHLKRADGSVFQAAEGVHTTPGTVSGPQGPRAIVTEHEFVTGAHIDVQVKVLRGDRQQADALLADKWEPIFEYMGENGLGALRKFTGDGFGTFEVTEFAVAGKRKVA